MSNKSKISILFSLYKLRGKLIEKRKTVAGLGNLKARLDGIIEEFENLRQINIVEQIEDLIGDINE